MPFSYQSARNDERPIGILNAGVSLRGYEPVVSVAASKTFTLADSGTIQFCTNAGSITLTIPLNSSVAFPIGTRINIRRSSGPSVNIGVASGVSALNESNSAMNLAVVSTNTIIRKIDTDTWTIEHPIPRDVNLPGTPTTTTQAAGNSSINVATTSFATTAVFNSSKPAIEASRSTAQTLTVGGTTTLICNVVQLDTNTAYNATTGIFTVPSGQGGTYSFSVYIGFSVAGSNCQIVPVKNGIAQESLRDPMVALTNDGISNVSSSLRIRLVPTDTLRFDVFYASISGTAASTSTVQFPSVSIHRIY